MSLDLNKLSNKLDEALSNETSETLNKFLNDKRMTNNKQQTAVKLYTEEEIKRGLDNPISFDMTTDEFINSLTPIELPSDEEIKEKLNVAYGNGYEQGEMDFYKKMQGKGDQYADGYSEGYKRALEYMYQVIYTQIKIKE